MKRKKTYTTELSVMIVAVCAVRFLLDGVTVGGFSVGHMDSMAFASIMTPILAAHGYLKAKNPTEPASE